MKKAAAAALIASILLIFSSCGQESDVPAGMKEASSDAAVFDMFVPESWIVDLQTGAVSAHVSSGDSSNVSVMAWGLEHNDDTVDDWWEFHTGELAETFHDMTEAEIENTTLGGIAAKKYTYTVTVGDVEYKYMQMAAVKNGSVYVLTYTALPDKFDSHLDDVADIANELRYR